MIQEIGNLILDLLRVRILRRNHDLRTFLSNLLQDLIDALVKQIVGVRTLLRVNLAVFDDGIDILKDL